MLSETENLWVRMRINLTIGIVCIFRKSNNPKINADRDTKIHRLWTIYPFALLLDEPYIFLIPHVHWDIAPAYKSVCRKQWNIIRKIAILKTWLIICTLPLFLLLNNLHFYLQSRFNTTYFFLVTYLTHQCVLIPPSSYKPAQHLFHGR